VKSVLDEGLHVRPAPGVDVEVSYLAGWRQPARGTVGGVCTVALCRELRQDERQRYKHSVSRGNSLDRRQRVRVPCAEIEVRMDHGLIDVFAVWRVGPDSCFCCMVGQS